jgi:mannosyltransferase OCH1-like enzyme
MVPATIHQIWNDNRVPDRLAAYAEGWSRLNPSWRRILWTDRMRLAFVAENYPELLETYCAYANPVCRADAARYMLLHKFGGLYADLDVECLAPLSPLEIESRVVLCHEPPIYWAGFAPRRGHPFVLFNGVMASPAGHPFWRDVLERLLRTRHGTSVIDVTGPCLLTAAYLGYGDKASIAVHSCHLFTPTRATRVSPLWHAGADFVHPALLGGNMGRGQRPTRTGSDHRHPISTSSISAHSGYRA